MEKGLKQISGQHGTVLLLVMVSSSVLIALVTLTLSRAYINLVRTELQNAADAAALAGANQLCVGPECFNRALQASINVLNEHTSHGSIGSSPTLAIDPNDRVRAPDYSWLWDYTTAPNDRNLRVRLERGLWIGTDATVSRLHTSDDTFQSLEDPSWQLDHPGVPCDAVANSVRVHISRPVVAFAHTTFGSLQYSVEVTATAIKGTGSTEACVAPFAIPVCALMKTDAAGNPALQDPAEICRHDRLFTEADRYCEGSECNIVPRFYWQMIINESLGSQWHPGVGGFTFNNSYLDYQCNWPSDPRAPKNSDPVIDNHVVYSTPSDNYGVVGIPNDPLPNEDKIRNVILSNPSAACVQAKIGDPFFTLPQGLQTSDTEDVIWNLINSGSVAAAKNPNLRDTADDLFYHAKECRTDSSTLSVYHHLPVDGDPVWDQPNLWPDPGFCGSRLISIVQNNTAPSRQFNNCSYSFGADVSLSTAKLWRVKVPIIADTSRSGVTAESCAGVMGAGSDPFLSAASFAPDREWTIVGFTDVYLSDVTMGPTPAVTDVCSPALTGDTLVSPRWGFNPTDLYGAASSVTTPCNLVRSRVVCDTTFLATSEGVGPQRSLLVS